MTDPASTTTSTTSGTAAAASRVLGPDAARGAGAGALASVVTAPAVAAVPADERFAAGGYVAGPPLPTVAQYKDEDGRVHHASPFSKATRARVAAGEWTEVDGSAQPFDPTGKLVREVLTYLEEHSGDQAEIDRVKAAEAAGEARPTIAAWSPAGE